MRSLYRTFTSAAAASLIASSSLFPLPVQSAMPFKQYQIVGDIPDAAFKRNDVIYGTVEKMVDGDTFRVRHHPFYPLSIGKRYKGRVTQATMSIRIYGVDCPELAHFGNPAMPLAQEATDFTRNLVDNRLVRIKLLRRDQYNRAVAKVTTRGLLPFTKNDVTLKLAERGLATMYTGGGAEYDGNRDLIEKKIKLAKRKKRGIWKDGDTAETPAEYKRRAKAKVAATKKGKTGHNAKVY